jgi:outer membrane protein W
MSRSTIADISTTAVTGFTNPPTVWTDIDLGNPVSFHIGIRETIEQNAQIDFGSGYQRGEIYLTNIELGLKYMAHIPFLNPWVGVGFVGGFMAVSNPLDRGVHDFMAAFNKETKAMRGTYGQVGLDLAIFGRMGLRIGYQEEWMNTDTFTNIGGNKVNFKNIRYSLGLVGPI